MPILEVFFDHTCPFCYKGYKYVQELLPQFPKAELKWLPIEAHPWDEEPDHKPYEHLAVQGALFVQDTGGDVIAYHERVFKAHFEEHKKVDDIAVLVSLASELGLDAKAFEKALLDKTYEKAQKEANDYAYGPNKVWAVPTFVSGEQRLDAAEGVGVSKEQVEHLLKELYV